ncbi:MAG: hypothetical protein JWO15_426 [Sphingomonadales bacterium]|nr:hypothetical protein [Sphingomonadales bacterium]
MTPSNWKRQNATEPTTSALFGIAKRFKLHLRLAREMHRDGYLRLISERPESTVDEKYPAHDRKEIFDIFQYYGLSRNKLIIVHNAGYINFDGLDYQKEASRYFQRHDGQLSVRLLCYLAYDEVRPEVGRIKDQAALGCLSDLKIDGRLNPPKDLEPYLDSASKGHSAALERVARWMRDLINSAGKPHGWAFYGVRLALVEGSHGLWNQPVPKLRKWGKRRKLAKLLREHHVLRGCVTRVAKPGRNSDYSYVYHQPGQFWDL